MKVVENREGSRWTPACVAFKGGGDPIIGNIARSQRFEVRCNAVVMGAISYSMQ